LKFVKSKYGFGTLTERLALCTRIARTGQSRSAVCSNWKTL